MPSSLIEVRRQYRPAEEAALIDAVHDALVAAFGVAAPDKNVRLLVHEPHRFAVAARLAAPERATLVTIDAITGRSLDAKRALYTGIVERFAAIGIPGDHVTILLRESAAENWGIRGGQAACDVLGAPARA